MPPPRPGEVLIVIPAYNEELSLPDTLAEVRRECPWADVVVINDGSADDTARITESLGYPVLSLPFNLGIGGAVQTGFQYALRGKHRVVVQVDADGQHPADAVLLLIKPVLDGACDVSVGSRFLEKRMYRQTFWRALGIWILARLISLIARKRITDPTSGFRAYSRDVVTKLALDYPYDYPEPEALVHLSRNGFRMLEIPVWMRPRRQGVSSIAPVSAKYMLKVVLAILLSLLRPRDPRAQGS